MAFGSWFELVWLSWVTEFGRGMVAPAFCQSLGMAFAGESPPSISSILPMQVAAGLMDAGSTEPIAAGCCQLLADQHLLENAPALPSPALVVRFFSRFINKDE